MPENFNQRKSGFTLIELLLVIAIIGVLATVLLFVINPFEQFARARDTGRLSSVKQLGEALRRNSTENGGIFSPLIANWQTNILKQKGEISNIITVTQVGTSQCGGASPPNSEGNICYSTSLASGGSDAIVWTYAESKNFASIASCGSNQSPIIAWTALEGTGITCLSNSAAVPTPDMANNTYDNISFYSSSNPNNSPTPSPTVSPTSNPTQTPSPTPPPQNIRNFYIASGIDPWGTAFDTNGNVWVAIPGCDPSPDCSNPTPGKIEEFNPVTTTWIATFQLPAGYGQPLFLAFDSSGSLWFPMFHTNAIGKLNPGTSTFQQWSVPTSNSGPWDVAIDHNGKVWFTEHYGNQIGKFDPITQTFAEFPTSQSNTQPYGITIDSNNNIWFTENNPSTALIGEYTSGQLKEYKIRNSFAGSLTPHLITVDPNGNIWWTEGFVGMIGELIVSQAQPGTTNGVTEYKYPNLCSSCGNHTSGISVDSNGVIWFDDASQGTFGGFPNSGSGVFSMFNAPGNHPHDGLNVDRNNNVWFDEEFSNTIAEATVNINQNPTTTPTPTPVLIAQDTFIRANQTFWGAASDGHNWGADAANNNIFSISNNSGTAVTSGGAIKTGILGPSITNGQVLFAGSTSSFSNSDFGAILRFIDSNNWYKAYIDGSNLLIRRNLNGNNIVLLSTPFPATSTTSYSLRFQITGNTLQAKVWTTNTTEPTNWMLTTIDSSISSGYSGLQVAGSGGIVKYTSFTANQI